MCGRVIQSSGPLRYTIVDGLNVRDCTIIRRAGTRLQANSYRRNHKTGEVSLDPLRWGLIPYWCKDRAGGRKPINAKCETVSTLPTFRDAYRLRRCILPVDGFYEWKATKGERAKQPYAIAMKDDSPFGVAGLGRTGKTPHPVSGSGHSRLSRPMRTSWWPKYMIGCPRYSHPSTIRDGSVTSPIPAI
jgi:hypothetical protein